ncbi:hypothetical protein, partial [Leptospira alexanderi]|uniref:hypothetical protein n=1 Tax=Leptospira alexanderi TaxID=100053 RepID=UPI001C37AFFC
MQHLLESKWMDWSESPGSAKIEKRILQESPKLKKVYFKILPMVGLAVTHSFILKEFALRRLALASERRVP